MSTPRTVAAIIGSGFLVVVQYFLGAPWRYPLLAIEFLALIGFTAWVTAKLTREIAGVKGRCIDNDVRLEAIAMKVTQAERSYKERVSREIDRMYDIRMQNDLGLIEKFMNGERDTIEA